MWHASVAPAGLHLAPATLERQARRELEGVGDAALGEWLQLPDAGAGRRALHLRRRLSELEQQTTGPAVDIRHDRLEVARRLQPVRAILGASYTE